MRRGKIAAIVLLLFSLVTLATARNGDPKELRTETVVVSKDLPFKTEYQLSRTVSAGRLKKSQAGKKGQIKRIYEVTRLGEKIVTKKLVDTHRVEPQKEIIFIGKAGFQTSRGAFGGGVVKTMTATAYHPYDGISRKGPPLTKMGIVATFGCIAVDPKVIPLGSWLYVEGYGLGYACDTGGAIKGNKIDVCLTDRRAIYNWGRRKVRVHILNTGESKRSR